LNNGLAIIITSPNANGVKAIQEQAHRYAVEHQNLQADKLDAHCQALEKAIAARKADFESHDIANGAVLVYTAETPDIVVVIQEDCCKWCVCGNGTPKGGCSRCCN
jgi:hypothetical protein